MIEFWTFTGWFATKDAQIFIFCNQPRVVARRAAAPMKRPAMRLRPESVGCAGSAHNLLHLPEASFN